MATRIVLLTTLTMVAFAANSILCRVALASGEIDAARFTMIRLLSGAVSLMLLVWFQSRRLQIRGSWFSGAALFVYACSFSYAYINLSAGTGALLLFGAVQVTMIFYGYYTGERFNVQQMLGVTAALSGLVWLLLPGVTAPPALSALLMMIAGVAWGVYSLRGRGATAPTIATAGNFVRALPFALVLLLLAGLGEQASPVGVAYAVLSGALASGLGYALWYAVLPALPATIAATVQLSVPIIATLGGVLLLGEAVSWRFVLSSTAVLGGIALVILTKKPAA